MNQSIALFSNLPPVPSRLFSALIDSANGMKNQHFRPDHKEVNAALAYIAPDDYDTWIKIGMALKEQFGANGFELWNGWSGKSYKYDSQEMRYKWESFKNDGITIGTVFGLAKQNGFKWSHGKAVRYAESTEYDATLPSEPRPLYRPLPTATTYPIEAFAGLAQQAIFAIHDITQAPLELCGQSVLAAMNLAVQAHANIKLPHGQIRPINGFYLTIAESGERKSACDDLALSAIRAFEAGMQTTHGIEQQRYELKIAAWQAQQKECLGKKHSSLEEKDRLLALLPPLPVPPLTPALTCPEPTFEGLCFYLENSRASIGVFSQEGGSFIGGYAMSSEHRLKTAAHMSALWDGEDIKRVRRGDGVTILAGKRVSMHLLVQPKVVALLLSDKLLASQGLLSRLLISAPNSTAGTRLWKEPTAESRAVLAQYNARMTEILRLDLPYTDLSNKKLAPRTLTLSDNARSKIIEFYNSVESELGGAGKYQPISGFANKLLEHTCRIAAVQALFENINARDIALENIERAILLTQYFASEALRLQNAGFLSPDLVLAQELHDWLQEKNVKETHLSAIYQYAGSALRDAKTAKKIMDILVDHGWAIPLAPETIVEGKPRREAWRIIYTSTHANTANLANQ